MKILKLCVLICVITVMSILTYSQPVYAGDDVNINIEMNNGKLSSGMTQDTSDKTWNTIFKKGKYFLAGLEGVAILVIVGMFIINCVKLANAGDNPSNRSNAIKGLLWCGLGAAGLGSITLIVSLFYNLL